VQKAHKIVRAIYGVIGEHGGMITLTRKEWCEIYYALELKSRALIDGKYGIEDYAGQDANWIAHLNGIIEKIGPDGRIAARNGVERSRF
jgi:hypothetical protein